MGEIVFFGGLTVFFLLGPWVLVWMSHRRRKRDRAADEVRWGNLTQRIFALEQELRVFKNSGGATAAPLSTETSSSIQTAAMSMSAAAMSSLAPAPSSETDVADVAVAPRETTREVLQASAVDIVSDRAVAPEARIPAEVAPTSEVVAPTAPAVSPPIAVEKAQHGEETFASAKATAAAKPGPSWRSALRLEERLGTNWLNKLGIGLLVLGVAFFLAYQLKTLGPAGKVLVGVVISAVLLGVGIWAEKFENYRILARAGVGGGWALLFFTTYAAYHVEAAHVLSSQAVDLVLLLAVAAAMVWHTLRYRSQVVTGLAFLLAFLTVTISHVNVYSLGAGAVLAAALAVVAVRMQWFEMEVFGIAASYLNHYLWLRPIIEPLHGRRHAFPEFAASAGILTTYWLIYRMSYISRSVVNQRQERVSTIAALLNSVLLLALFKYQSTHPEWAFWALLAIGAAEVVLAQLPITRRRRTAVVVLSTIGVVLLISAIPFRYSGTQLALLWLVEAEALLLIGVWTKEIVFRRLGVLAQALVAGQMISYDAAEVLGRRMDGAVTAGEFRLSIIFGVAAIVFYANAHWVARRWAELFEPKVDRTVMLRLSYVAAAIATIGAWIAFPGAWTAVAWALLGLALAIAGQRLRIDALTYQANFIGVAAVARCLVENLNDAETFHGISLRLITVMIVAAVVYLSSRWSWTGELGKEALSFYGESLEWSRVVAGAHTWAASTLLALLAWYELRPVSVAVVWAVLGVVLFEVGLSRRLISLRMQAYVAFVAAFLRMFFVNLNASGTAGEISPRVYTTIPLALIFFYAYWRLLGAAELSRVETRWRAAAVCAYLGTGTVASLMRFELPSDWVAAGWAALVLVLLAIAWRTGQRLFLHQALLLSVGVVFRTVLHNFYQRSYFPVSGWWDSRLVTGGAVVVLLLASMVMAFQLRGTGTVSARWRIARALQTVANRPEQVMFFASVGILTVLLALEMRHGMVTMSWGLEGVVVFLLALWLGERSFRLTGLGLLLMCVGKILLVDVWRLNPRDRYLSFIVLGCALLLVSFMYTRHRETLRQYL